MHIQTEPYPTEGSVYHSKIPNDLIFALVFYFSSLVLQWFEEKWPPKGLAILEVVALLE